MYEKLVNYAAKQLELDPSEITPDSTFESLGIELDMEDQKISTFQELADFIDTKVN